MIGVEPLHHGKSCTSPHLSKHLSILQHHLVSKGNALQARTCWDRAIESAGGLEVRQSAVEAFNAGSRFRKRGLALTPTKFGISFTTKFLNQVWPPCPGAQCLLIPTHTISGTSVRFPEAASATRFMLAPPLLSLAPSALLPSYQTLGLGQKSPFQVLCMLEHKALSKADLRRPSTQQQRL